MVKTLVIGIWAAIVALAASTVAAHWKAGIEVPTETPYLEGLEYRKLEPLTVPMIGGGAVNGYVLARLVFTADAGAIRALPIEPEPIVADEAFREIYENGQVEFGRLAKYNLDKMASAIRENANERLGPDFVKDVLIEEINYFDRDAAKAGQQEQIRP